MKYLIQLLLLLAGVASFAQSTSADTNDEFYEKLKTRSSALLQECVTFEESAGISGGIYMDGRMVWLDAAGHMDMEENKSAPVDMIHRIASISKPMTAIAILQLMERGLLTLDDPIQKHIPDYPIKTEGIITIRHLLNHSSGIKAYKNGREAFPTKNYPTLRKAIELFEDRELANIPGEGYKYSTYGYVVLGLIIENVSGQSYRSYMQKNIWDIADMTDTDVEIFGQTHNRKSKLYTTDNDGKFVTDKSTNLSVKVPGGGIQSTVSDLLKFAQAVLENKLISAETTKLMITDSGIKKRGNPYGLGWFLYSDENKPSGRIIGHSGSQSGTATQLFIFLDKKAAIAVISNTGDAWNSVFALTDKLADPLVRPEDVNKPIKKVEDVSSEILDMYVGKYKFESGTVVELSRKGNTFYGKIEGVGKSKVYATSDTQFFVRGMNLLFEFESSTTKAQQLILTENGEKYIANRQ